MSVPSPCVNICVLDPRGQLCTGCFRTIDEIGIWAGLDDGEKQDVLNRATERRAAMQGTTIQG